MPRARSTKIRCAYAEPDPLARAKVARAVKAAKPKLTEEQKEQKKLEAAERAVVRKAKKDWEASLQEWKAGDSHRGISFPNGTRVLFKSDAKRDFGLNDKDIAALPFQGFAGSWKRVYSVERLKAFAKRKYEATGIDYSKRDYPDNPTGIQANLCPPLGMIKTSERLTGLEGRNTE